MLLASNLFARVINETYDAEAETNVNSACDVANLDQIGPISVQDV